jgi:hypothetical protein
LKLGRLRLRGPRGAQDEFVLAAVAQNLRRLATLVARPPPAHAVALAKPANGQADCYERYALPGKRGKTFFGAGDDAHAVAGADMALGWNDGLIHLEDRSDLFAGP